MPEPCSVTVSSRITAVCNRVMQWIPAKARLAVLVGSLVLLGLVAYTFLSSGSATLNLVCRHNLRTADLSVFIDGKLSYEHEISGSSLKQFGILGKRVEGTFSKSLAVSSGDHTVQVHLASTADGFDQVKQRGLHLVAGKEATLVITTQRGGMSLAVQGFSNASATDIGSSYSGSVRSILVTVMGSAVSAAIGFAVQEFLRSRKAA
jgi:hypothetical protein